MYKFFCFKIELKKIKADSYMPCKAMAHSTKYCLKLTLRKKRKFISSGLAHAAPTNEDKRPQHFKVLIDD
jgi:hypothetical protein